MKRAIIFVSALALLAGCNCKKSDKKQDNPELATSLPAEKKAVVLLESKSGSASKGTVTFTEKDGVVTLVFKGEGFTPGTHAIHIHEKADCSAADGTSTGGHWNPTFQPHGKWGDAGGYHKGDIGNFVADENGNASLTFSTDQWCLGCPDENSNLIGHSVIIHEKQDDFTTQPTGNAGGRINCGGIIVLEN